MPYCEKRKGTPYLRPEVCKSKNGCNGEHLGFLDIEDKLNPSNNIHNRYSCDFRPTSEKRIEKRKKK